MTEEMKTIEIPKVPFVLGDPLTPDDPTRPIYGPEDRQGVRPLVGWVLRKHAETVMAYLVEESGE